MTRCPCYLCTQPIMYMKNLLLKTFMFALALSLAACGQKSHDHEGHDHDHDHDHSHEAASSPNETLQEEVMKVHDEVMPKMNDIYKIKQELKKKLEEAP